MKDGDESVDRQVDTTSYKYTHGSDKNSEILFLTKQTYCWECNIICTYVHKSP